MSRKIMEQLRKYLHSEQSLQPYCSDGAFRVALCFPNVYHVGMSNLGFHVIYEQIVKHPLLGCQRFFLPDLALMTEYERTGTALLSIEKQERLRSFDIAAFAISFEMDYVHFLKMLDLSQVALRQSERTEKDPLIVVGGPCATFNPEPLADFVDVFVIGEGEETVSKLLDSVVAARADGLSRSEILRELSHIEGLYVPSLYQVVYQADGAVEQIKPLDTTVPDKVRRQWVRNLDEYPSRMSIVTDLTEFKELFLLEVARGCGRHCRFCMAGYCFRQPRSRSLASLKQDILIAKEYRHKVGLVGAALSDYPNIDELCEFILEQGLKLSVASLRADSLTPGLVQALALSGHRTITLAPEAGSARLRRVINKGFDEDALIRAIDLALAAGIPNLRYYIMVGLPFETEADIQAIVELAVATLEKMRSKGSKGKLTLSINPFVPKPNTPFQWLPMVDQQVVKARLKLIREGLKAYKAIEVLMESTKEAYIQAVLARGDRRLSLVLERLARQGSWAGWKRAIKELAVDESFYLDRIRQEHEVFPWSHLEAGMAEGYLKEELNKAKQEEYTIPCFEGCRRCGVCR